MQMVSTTAGTSAGQHWTRLQGCRDEDVGGQVTSVQQLQVACALRSLLRASDPVLLENTQLHAHLQTALVTGKLQPWPGISSPIADLG